MSGLYHQQSEFHPWLRWKSQPCTTNPHREIRGGAATTFFSKIAHHSRRLAPVDMMCGFLGEQTVIPPDRCIVFQYSRGAFESMIA